MTLFQSVSSSYKADITKTLESTRVDKEIASRPELQYERIVKTAWCPPASTLTDMSADGHNRKPQDHHETDTMISLECSKQIASLLVTRSLF